ncbi:MAG: histidine kinase [Bacteroidota bacterium]
MVEFVFISMQTYYWNRLTLKSQMTIQQFIFSNERKCRLARHLAFWGVYCLIAFYSEFNLDSLADLKIWKTYRWNLRIFVMFLPMSVFMVYVFIYVLIPRFILKKKYFTFIIAAFCTIAFCFAVDMVPGYIINFFFEDPPAEPSMMHFIWFGLNYNHSLHKGISLAMAATCIKLTKGWYLQQIENNRLAAEEAANRIRLFKSQIHPRFLFHSLQSLYKKLKNNPDEAPELVIRLADIFSYILYDCNEEYVLLEKEIIAIQNFAITENMDKEIHTQIQINIQGDCDNKYIAPLALFSFLEKHVDERVKSEPFKLSIDIKDSILSLVIQMGDQSAGHAENIEMNSSKKWKDNSLANFSDYKISRDEQGNSLTIDATVALTRICSNENIRYYSIAEN